MRTTGVSGQPEGSMLVLAGAGGPGGHERGARTMNGTTGRQARRRRIDAMPVAMGILLAAGLLSGCGSDAGRIMLSPSEQPAAASSDAPSADGSSSAPSSFPSSSSSAETSPGTDSLDPAAIP